MLKGKDIYNVKNYQFLLINLKELLLIFYTSAVYYNNL